MIVGVAMIIESFYKPELNAAHPRGCNHQVLADGIKIPESGYN
jgi:hypothetical protein